MFNKLFQCASHLLHTRTSPDASPENVDVFVGSDSTNSVTAPCLFFALFFDLKKLHANSDTRSP